MLVAMGWETGGMGSCCLMCEDEKSLEISCTAMRMYLTLLSCTLKYGLNGQFQGNSPVVQWLGHHAFTAESVGWILGWGTKKKKMVNFIFCIFCHS